MRAYDHMAWAGPLIYRYIFRYIFSIYGFRHTCRAVKQTWKHAAVSKICGAWHWSNLSVRLGYLEKAHVIQRIHSAQQVWANLQHNSKSSNLEELALALMQRQGQGQSQRQRQACRPDKLGCEARIMAHDACQAGCALSCNGTAR